MEREWLWAALLLAAVLWVLVSAIGFAAASVRLRRADDTKKHLRQRIRRVWAVMLYLSAAVLAFFAAWMLGAGGSVPPEAA